MNEKRSISAKQVLADLRAGMSRDQLMQKYGISETGLQSVLVKLTNGGLISQADLDRWLKGAAISASEKRKALAQRISKAVTSGLSNEEIVREFGISASKLPAVYASLVKAGYLKQEDVDRQSAVVRMTGQPPSSDGGQTDAKTRTGGTSTDDGVIAGEEMSFYPAPRRLLLIGLGLVVLVIGGTCGISDFGSIRYVEEYIPLIGWLVRPLVYLILLAGVVGSMVGIYMVISLLVTKKPLLVISNQGVRHKGLRSERSIGWEDIKGVSVERQDHQSFLHIIPRTGHTLSVSSLMLSVGLDDVLAAISQHYDIDHAKPLRAYAGKFVEEQALAKLEEEGRPSQPRVVASGRPSTEEPERVESTRDVLRDFAQRFNIPREDIERLKTASLGDIKAFFAKHDIPLHEGKEIFKALGFKAGDLAAEAKESLLEGFRSIKEGVNKGSLKAFPTKLLAIGATAVMLGWLIAGLLTTGWLWFLIWLVVLAAVAFLGLFFIGEKSKLQGKLTAAHFGAAAAVILVLNVAFLGGALKSDMSQWESVHGQALDSPQYLLKRDLLCSLHPHRMHEICSDGGRLEDRVEEGEAILLLKGSTVEHPGSGGSWLAFTTYSRQRGRLVCCVCNTEDIKTSFSPRLWP